MPHIFRVLNFSRKAKKIAPFFAKNAKNCEKRFFYTLYPLIMNYFTEMTPFFDNWNSQAAHPLGLISTIPNWIGKVCMQIIGFCNLLFFCQIIAKFARIDRQYVFRKFTLYVEIFREINLLWFMHYLQKDWFHGIFNRMFFKFQGNQTCDKMDNGVAISRKIICTST